METDSDYEEQYSDSEEVSDASMDDGDDDDYFDTTADTQQRKVGLGGGSNHLLPVAVAWSKAPCYCCPLLLLQTKYVVLTRDDIHRRQQEVIDAVTSVLGISNEDAGRILRKYKW
jgi:hypothetical protein